MHIKEELKEVIVIFSERLRQLREEKGLTQQELAEKLNIGRASISNYELGTRTPDIEVLNKLADFFGVTTDYLIGRSEYKTFEEENMIKAYAKNEIIDMNLKEILLNITNQFLKLYDNDILFYATAYIDILEELINFVKNLHSKQEEILRKYNIIPPYKKSNIDFISTKNDFQLFENLNYEYDYTDLKLKNATEKLKFLFIQNTFNIIKTSFKEK